MSQRNDSALIVFAKWRAGPNDEDGHPADGTRVEFHFVHFELTQSNNEIGLILCVDRDQTFWSNWGAMVQQLAPGETAHGFCFHISSEFARLCIDADIESHCSVDPDPTAVLQYDRIRESLKSLGVRRVHVPSLDLAKKEIVL